MYIEWQSKWDIYVEETKSQATAADDSLDERKAEYEIDERAVS